MNTAAGDLRFLEGLDEDLRRSTLAAIRDQWTHHSTAIEGNSLSLSDTRFVIEEGLTVAGKPLKDHEEVIGHARALELLYGMLRRKIADADFFALHKAVQTEQVTDIFKPQGAWKNRPNGTYGTDADGKTVFIEFAAPADVPALMEQLTAEINRYAGGGVSPEDAHLVYAKIHIGFTRIHPFWDGNGRIGRLVANLPLLNAGLPPIVMPVTRRREYIASLAEYELRAGVATAARGPWNEGENFDSIVAVCAEVYDETQAIVRAAFDTQKQRIPPEN